MLQRNVHCFLIVTACVILFAEGCNEDLSTADAVFMNGKVYTMNKEQPWAESVAISGKEIVYVGTDRKAKRFVGSHTKVIHLDGKMVVPAFVDSHMHPVFAYMYEFMANLTDVFTHEEYIAKIQTFADEHPEMSWIQGVGFARSIYDEIGPRKEWLDAIDETRPISIYSIDGHSLWVNSKALEIAGITEDTPDPDFGVILRDPDTGKPSGLLQEAAMNLVLIHAPSPAKSDVKTAILHFQEFLNSRGITTVHDAAIGDPNVNEMYNEFAEADLLTVRVRGSLVVPPDDSMAVVEYWLTQAERFNHPHFKTQSFKFYADGVVEERSAFLLEPYESDPGYYGLKAWENTDDMAAAMTTVDAAGYQIHVHTVGDGAVRYTLDAIEAARQTNGVRDARHSLAHVQMATPEDRARMGQLGMSAHMSPYWHVIDSYYWEMNVPFLGERANQTYPHKSLFDAGVNVTCASDFGVSEPDVMAAIYMGMYRVLPQRIFDLWYGAYPEIERVTDPNANLKSGQIGVLKPLEERVSLDQMLRSATINGAYANYLETEIGTIETGKLADLVVLDTNLFEVTDPEEIANVRIVITFFEGQPVYFDESLLSSEIVQKLESIGSGAGI